MLDSLARDVVLVPSANRSSPVLPA